MIDIAAIDMLALLAETGSLEAKDEQSVADVIFMWVTAFFLLCSAVFSFIAAIGIVRMPDLFTRMQAAAKTGTLGVGCALLALTFHFADVGVTTRAALVILFLFLTAPIAAHLIARAGYITGLPLWEGSVTDEMKDQYNLETHELSSGRYAKRTASDTDDSDSDKNRIGDPRTRMERPE